MLGCRADGLRTELRCASVRYRPSRDRERAPHEHLRVVESAALAVDTREAVESERDLRVVAAERAVQREVSRAAPRPR